MSETEQTLTSSQRCIALVVEDDENVRETTRDLCASLGHQVVATASVEEAEEALRNHRFDYVMLDLELPIRTGRFAMVDHGFGLLARLGDLPANTRPIVVVMTAHGQDHAHCRRAFLSGCDDFVKKPFDEGTEAPQWRIRRFLRKRPEQAQTIARVLGAASTSAKANRDPAAPFLFLVGDYDRRNCGLRIRGQTHRVSEQRFRLLGYLAAHALHHPGQMLHLSDVPDARARPGQAIHRLKSALRPLPGWSNELLVQDGHGGWRLDMPAHEIAFDPECMREHAGLLRRLVGEEA
jgi:CheY-like chemotaxis protein